jgi:hypothetical protein
VAESGDLQKQAFGQIAGMTFDPQEPLPCGRFHPAQGVLETPGGRTILFCTVCTKDRRTWLANAEVAATLERIWRTEARAWITGRWLLMPDHAHFFCTPFAGAGTAWRTGHSSGKNGLPKRSRSRPASGSAASSTTASAQPVITQRSSAA